MLERLCGNEALKENLSAALAAGRLPHSVLLCGAGGLGKNFAARLLAADYLYPAGGPGAEAVLAGPDTEVRALLPGSHQLPAREGWYCSLFPAQGPVEGLWLENLKYPLQNARLAPDWPLGVSNEFLQGPAHIRFSQGALYCVLCRKDL